MSLLVVLLRGVNVGRHNRIAMADLRALLDGVGCRDVRTYVQSGNAVVTSKRSPASLETAVAGALAAAGLPARVMVRTAEELARVVAQSPWDDLDPKQYQVAFLSAQPEPAAVEAIDHEALLPERLVVGERVLYMDHAGRIQNSRLDRVRLGVEATARNWRSVLALQEMAPAQGSATRPDAR